MSWQDRAEVLVVTEFNIPIDAVRPLVERAVAEAREHGEELDTYHGTPEEWVAEQEFKRQPDSPETWRDIVIMTFAIATTFAVLFQIVIALRGLATREHTIGAVAFPILAAVLTTVLYTVTERLNRTRGFTFAAIAAGVIVVAGSLGIAGFIGATQDTKVTVPIYIWLVQAVIFGLATWGATLLPEPKQSIPYGTWFEQFAQAMRARGDYTEREIRNKAEEVRWHTRSSRSDVRDEFGDPHTYAASLPQKHGLRERRVMYVSVLMTVLVGVLLIGDIVERDVSWWTVAWFVLCLMWTASHIHRARNANNR